MIHSQSKSVAPVAIRRCRYGILCLVSFVVLATTLVGKSANPSRTVLKVGGLAPQFSGTDEQGKTWKSADHIGKKILVVYFFPADFLSSATKQAKQFSDDIKGLRSKGVEVVGISADSVKTHEQFKRIYKLDFTLISDEEGRIAKQFGVRVRSGGTIRPRTSEIKSVTRKATLSWKVVAINRDGKIRVNKTRVSSLLDIELIFRIVAKDFWSNRADKKSVWIPSRERDWRKVLSRKAFLITRKSKTERKFTGKYNRTKRKGIYRCVGCGLLLFNSKTKFNSGSGWPAFWDPVGKNRLTLAKDTSNGTLRVEVKCKRCQSHLGHVFADGPAPTGQRYCINSAALILDGNRATSLKKRR